MVSIRLVRPRGLTSYAQGLLLQAEALRRVRQGKGDTLIVLEHEPVYTAGRRSASQINSGRLAHTTMAGDQLLPAPVVATDRGGQVTFHGPGQLVLYPILDLRRFQQSLRWYVTGLEQVMIKACAGCGLMDVQGRASVGVWTATGGKIGFIGFKNSGWITSHGMALNVTDEPLAYFGHIIPCGDPLGRVTSLSAELRSIGSGTSGGDMGREISPRDGRSPHPPTEGHPFLMRRMEALLLEAFSDTFHCDWFQDQGC